MEKAFKVFVSSTFRDLEGEREEIKNNINNISLESIGMESFVPSEKTAHETSLEELKKADIYLLLIGESYGTVIGDCRIACELKGSVCQGNISYTHCEYRTARHRNMPPVCFRLSHKKLEGDLKKFKEEVENDVYLKPIEKNNLKKEVEEALKKDIKRWICEGTLNLPEFYGRTEEIKELLEAKPSTVFVKGIGGIGKTTLIEAFLLVKKIDGAEILEVVKERDYNRTDVGYRLARGALERKEYKALDLRGLAEILEISVQQDDETIIKNIIYALNNSNLILFVDDAHEIKDERVFDLIGRCSNSLNNGKIILAGREDLKVSVGKIVPVEKGVEDHEFIKSVFRDNGKKEEWNRELSDKIMKITSGHPLAVKLVVRNLDYPLDLDKFGNILKDAYDEKQAEQFIGRITREILGTDFEKPALLSVHRIPFILDNSEARKLIAKMILEKRNGEFFFNYDLIQEVLYASIEDKKQAHKEASEYYKKFEGSSNYKGIAEYLYHLAKSGDEKVYKKYDECSKILGMQGYFRELIDVNEELLEKAKEEKNKFKESVCYANLGVAYRNLGDFKKGVEYLENSLKIKKEIGDKAGESKSYTNLGNAYQGLGDFKKGVEYLENSLKIKKEIGDKAGEAACYANLGNAYYNLGDFKKAIEYHENSLKIFKAIGDKAGEFKCHANLGLAYYSLGDFKKAIEYHENSLKIFKAIGDTVGEAACYANLGLAYADLGDFNKAIEYYKNSLKIKEEIGDKAGEAKGYGNLGNAYCGLCDFKKAIEYHENSLKMDKEIGDKAGESKGYGNLGTIYANLGNFNKAIEFHEKALKIALNIGDVAWESACYTNLGIAYDGLGNFRKAVEFYLKAEKIFKEIGQEHYLKIVYGNMAIVYRKMNNPEKAEEYRKLYENF